MKKALALIALTGLLLAGCTEDEVQYVNKYIVVQPPGSLYNCPTIKRYPNIKNLRELEIARTIYQLAENNRICKSSLNAIKAYIDGAQQRISANGSARRR